MPLYEYQCESCEKRFERIQKFSDPLVDTCPDCGGKVHKLLSSPAIQFKGTGWYITDYARKKSSDGGKSAGSGGGNSDKSSTGDSGSADKSSTTSDSKPATPATPAKADA